MRLGVCLWRCQTAQSRPLEANLTRWYLGPFFGTCFRFTFGALGDSISELKPGPKLVPNLVRFLVTVLAPSYASYGGSWRVSWSLQLLQALLEVWKARKWPPLPCFEASTFSLLGALDGYPGPVLGPPRPFSTQNGFEKGTQSDPKACPQIH